jgi:YHS domain-containing protein
MITPICPGCGCSLVRLGISKQESVTYGYNGKDYNFCCNGCVRVFMDDPEKYLLELNNIVVCLTCLGEKPIQSSVSLDCKTNEFHFCRCPHCTEEFRKNPQYFIKRYSGLSVMN